MGFAYFCDMMLKEQSMRKYLCLLAVYLMTMPLWPQNATVVKELKLKNGFTVWLNEDHAQPKVYGAVVVKAGAKDCPGTGIAHYFEHLLFKGTDKIGTVDYAAERVWLDSIAVQYDVLAQTKDDRRRLEIQRKINEFSMKAADYAIPNEFESLISMYGGTGLNAYTSFDETVYYNTFSPQYIAQWCELNAERLVSPVFRLFQGELETVYEEKNMYADQMLVQAAEAAQRYALAGTPYAEPILGTTESLKNPRLSEMRTFYEQYYVASNMGLMLCGDIHADSLEALLERTFGRIRSGKAPEHETSVMRNLKGREELKIKLPIPIVKAGGYVFKAPSEHSADYATFQVMSALLSNEAKTGLLDSLSHAHRLMMAMAQGYDFKDFSVYGFGFVPKIPFGSKRKADALCWEQVDKLRNGVFSTDALDAVKLGLRRKHSLSLEGIEGRSKAMINAFSHGLTWEDVLAQDRMLAAVTRDDVVNVARKYFNDDSLKVSKKFGRYTKERVSQPGYKPVTPKNAGKKSAYAMELATMPYEQVAPKLLDFEKDARCRQLGKLVNLYTVGNPVNDIFRLQLVFRRGTWHDRRMEAMAQYVNSIGTQLHGKQQLARALQQVGASLSVSASSGYVMVSLTGFDEQLKPALALLQEFLAKPKVDVKKYDDLLKSVKIDERSFLKDNSDIADAVFEKVEFGNRSSCLQRLSAKELKCIKPVELVALFKDVQHEQLDIFYSGTLDDEEVERAVREYVDIRQVDKPWKYVSRQLCTYDEPCVFIYDHPSARQTIVGSYQSAGALPDAVERMKFQLWGNYFGGGMSSVMFQDIREFRSYAYSVYGSALFPDLKMCPTDPCAYITRMGTQADKAMQALSVLDTLLADMPIRETNLAAARQHIISRINNGYPAFRTIARMIAHDKLLGYTEDPDLHTVSVLPTLELQDMENIYEQRIKNRPKAMIVVGDKRSLDMEKLRKWGTVVELKASDVYNK